MAEKKIMLLTNENFVREVTAISDNIAGKYLLPAISEAQEIHLKSILGTTLLAKLKQLIKDDAFRGDFGPEEGEDYDGDYSTTVMSANEHYHALIENCQYYLAYKSVSELLYKVTYKIGNFGVSKTTDEGMQSVSEGEVDKMRSYYISQADFYALELQNYLLNNRTLFPELNDGDYHRIYSNVYSAATGGLWLGGARNK